MPEIAFVLSRADGPVGQMAGLSDLLWRAGEGRLYAVAPGGVSLRDGDLRLLAVAGGAASEGLAAPRRLLEVDLGGAPALLAPGRLGADLEFFRPRGDALSGRGGLRLDEGGAQAITALAVTGDLYVTASRQVPGLTAWRRVGDRLEPVSQVLLPASPDTVLDLALHSGAGGLRVVASLPGAGGLAEVPISPGGLFGAARRLDARDGLYLNRPADLETLRVAGTEYLLAAAPGSSSLAVLARDAGGALRITDHVGDDRATRFAGISVLEAIAIGGQGYVVAGGRDDGVSLMTLLPGGRLLHLDTLADDTRMHLGDPAALALGAGGAGIDVFVAGEAATQAGTGLTRLRVDLGPIGRTLALGPGDDRVSGGVGRDQFHGGAGDDVLSGGGGADVLVDGPGQDVLSGGAGADVFVLLADGEADRIADFEIGTDRIDLSGWGRLYTVEALDITRRPDGAEIRFGDEVLRVATSDGRGFGAGDLGAADLFDLWHLELAPLPETGLRREGGAGPDYLDGRGGDDLLLGEAMDPAFDAASGRVFRLYQAALDRAPDLRGLMAWSGRLLDGERGLLDIAAGFTRSREFAQRYGATDSGDYVTLLYANVLGRAPDPGGFANWTGQIDSGARSREQVLIGFSESAEMIARSEAGALVFSRAGLQAQMSDEVFRLYLSTLGRLPDPGGMLGWTGRLAQSPELEPVVRGFTQSREFRQVYGAVSDGDFVALLYENVLGRAPDAAGYAAWTARLAGGWSRETVVLGFSQSPEFIRDSAPRLEAWMRGEGPDDRLDGGGGDNLLMGGIGADVFLFHHDDAGRHEVADPEPWDSFSFEGFGYVGPRQVRARTFLRDGDLVFEDQGVRVILPGLAGLTDDMILL
ncbi:DUF4214 domain-containing protein [Limimaricola pyoseonensis]|uniref:Hemolysin-type calcium-binding repeat-containing protein n=1 Tax=Limimaricola pyoseonensis TaxID=521013 RepID=A0A1G7KIX9_9RHOB|nr:DUF4214 domain-containing protein [Limimaricola pyoseonensis]SDF37228.1 Hemolysin-type calcium-binding repeat-containing protein [Limimaricola pyoseonensis]